MNRFRMLAMSGAIGLVLATAPASAQDMGFKGVPFGATQAEVARLGKLFCQRDATGLADVQCIFEDPSKRTFAGQFTKGLWLYFIAGRFDSFTGDFQPSAFSPIQEAMQEKYGPAQCDPAPKRVCTWQGPRGYATLDFHRGETLLSVGSAVGKAERTRRLNERRAKLKRDV